MEFVIAVLLCAFLGVSTLTMGCLVAVIGRDMQWW